MSQERRVEIVTMAGGYKETRLRGADNERFNKKVESAI